MTDSIRTHDRLGITRVLGDCGVEIQTPKNILAEIRYEAEFGLQWHEFDVWQTLDNTLVPTHDEALERTTDGRRGCIS